MEKGGVESRIYPGLPHLLGGAGVPPPSWFVIMFSPDMFLPGPMLRERSLKSPG
jgi:hypothetical protein